MIRSGDQIIISVEEDEERIKNIIKLTLESVNTDDRGTKLNGKQAAMDHLGCARTYFSQHLNRKNNPIPSHGKGRKMHFFTKELDRWNDSLKFE